MSTMYESWDESTGTNSGFDLGNIIKLPTVSTKVTLADSTKGFIAVIVGVIAVIVFRKPLKRMLK